MRRWLGRWGGTLVCLVGFATNAVFAATGHAPLRYFSAAVAGLCFAASVYLIGVTKKTKPSKEETPSSPNLPPTSGTYPNPSLWRYPYQNYRSMLGLLPSPSPSEKVSESPFQPETRSVPVVGFRSWNTTQNHRLGIGPGWELASYNRHLGTWKPGRNDATCRAGGDMLSFTPPPHRTPSADCTCGFYVLTDFDKVPFATQRFETGPVPVTMVVGAVVGWGRVIQHGDEGWRAEKTQIIALLDCKVSDEHLRITREVAESYGVPVLGRTALELLAKEYGDKLA